MLENGVVGRIVQLIVVVGPKAGTGLDRFQIFYSFFAPGQNWPMPRMGGKNAQTTFSEFCLSMKQTPATVCPVLRVLVDWILELYILAPSQLIVMWESGGLGQNALSFVVVALKAETGRDLFFFFAPLFNFRTKLADAENEGEECENPFRILPLNETQSCNQNSCPGN